MFSCKNCLLLSSFLLLFRPSLACTSVRHKQVQSNQILTNEVDSYPNLFTIDLMAAKNAANNHAYLKSMCPKARPTRTCQVVSVNWDALRADKMGFLIGLPSDVAILKKTSQEGLEMVLDQQLNGATATITYKYDDENVIFVVQGQHIYGNLHDKKHGKFSLKPCPYNETCHVLLQKLP